MKQLSILIMITMFSFSCSRNKHIDLSGIRLDKEKIREIISVSNPPTIDTPGRKDFFFIEDYTDKTDGTITRILLDSLRNIVGVNQRRNGITIFAAEYYINGQIRGTTTVSSEGNITGPAVYYYEDGKISSSGYLKDGVQVGEWKKFDESGKLMNKWQTE